MSHERSRRPISHAMYFGEGCDEPEAPDAIPIQSGTRLNTGKQPEHLKVARAGKLMGRASIVGPFRGNQSLSGGPSRE